MSDEEHNIGDSDGELLTAEFKDGKLEIVEVASYSRANKQLELPGISSDGAGLKYVQVLEAKDTVVDLLNFTLVRSEDGQESYRLVSNIDADGVESDATVTCVLSSEDGDGKVNQFLLEQENQEYVMVEGIQDGDEGPLVFLQSAVEEAKVVHHNIKRPEIMKATFKTPSSPTEIIEKAKAYQKAKILMRCTEPRPRNVKQVKHKVSSRGRRKSELPPPHELLASPNFKLFLYSCKLCRFKCNAIKELTAHKALEHAGGGSGGGARWRGGSGGGARWRGAGRAAAGTLQCARCPFRAATHTQLMKHVQESHVDVVSTKVYLDSAEVEAADVLVCGACGFESASREVFKKHIEDEHGATTC